MATCVGISSVVSPVIMVVLMLPERVSFWESAHEVEKEYSSGAMPVKVAMPLASVFEVSVTVPRVAVTVLPVRSTVVS